MKGKGTQKKTGRFASQKEETAHYTAILVEDLKDQFRFVTEKVGSVEGSLQSRMTQMETSLRQEVVDNRRALELRIDGAQKTLSEKIDQVSSAVSRQEDEITSLKRTSDQ